MSSDETILADVRLGLVSADAGSNLQRGPTPGEALSTAADGHRGRDCRLPLLSEVLGGIDPPRPARIPVDVFVHVLTLPPR